MSYRAVEHFLQKGTISRLPRLREGTSYEGWTPATGRTDHALYHGEIVLQDSIEFDQKRPKLVKVLMHAYMSGIRYNAEKRLWYTAGDPESVLTPGEDTPVYFFMFPVQRFGLDIPDPRFMALCVSRDRHQHRAIENVKVPNRHQPCGSFLTYR